MTATKTPSLYALHKPLTVNQRQAKHLREVERKKPAPEPKPAPKPVVATVTPAQLAQGSMATPPSSNLFERPVYRPGDGQDAPRAQRPGANEFLAIKSRGWV
jgi:hypothetical protein